MTTADRDFGCVDVATVVLVHAVLVAALLSVRDRPVTLAAAAPIVAQLIQSRSPAPTPSVTGQKPRSIPPLAMHTPPRRHPSPAPVQPVRDKSAPAVQLTTTRPAADRAAMAAPAQPAAAEPDPPPTQALTSAPEETAHTSPPARPVADRVASAAAAESTATAAAASAPAQDVQPTGASAEMTDDHRAYLAALLQRLNRYKVYPAALRKEKVEGRVVLTFTIGADGAVTGSDVQRSSGHDGLDQAAERMLTRASPLPAIPKSMHRTSLTLSVPVEYSLVTDR